MQHVSKLIQNFWNTSQSLCVSIQNIFLHWLCIGFAFQCKYFASEQHSFTNLCNIFQNRYNIFASLSSYFVLAFKIFVENASCCWKSKQSVKKTDIKFMSLSLQKFNISSLTMWNSGPNLVEIDCEIPLHWILQILEYPDG